MQLAQLMAAFLVCFSMARGKLARDGHARRVRVDQAVRFELTGAASAAAKD
jgi:hypothetical protein